MALQRTGGNITRALVEQIGGAIVRGDYLSGDQLPTEADLSAHYQASRTVTREAIKTLTGKGLVQSWPKRGTLVEDEKRWNLMDPDVLGWLLDRRPSIDLVKDFLNMRLAIEPAAASMAASKRANTDEIAAALRLMRDADRGVGDTLDADSAFHAAVLRASSNRFFSQMAPLVGTALRMTARWTNRIKGVNGPNVDDHERILTAISKGQSRAARRASAALIQEALDLIQSQHDDLQGTI